jgi:hypothetical protein
MTELPLGVFAAVAAVVAAAAAAPQYLPVALAVFLAVAVGAVGNRLLYWVRYGGGVR